MLARYASRRGLTQSTLTPEAIEVLQNHDWPGNIRELANVIERATILAGGGPILPEHLPTQIPAARQGPAGRGRRRSAAPTSRSPRATRPSATSR